MKGTKITITGNLAHFKSSLNSAYQTSYKLPPISTVIGILQNIYGEEHINKIKFGYKFEYEESNFHICIHKKVNASFTADKNGTDKTNNQLEYLEFPILTIYVVDNGLDKIINNTLNLGKTDCLCFADFENVEIEHINAYTENIYTEMMEGDGVIDKITSETRFDLTNNKYMYNYKMVRLNEEFECEWSVDGEGIYIWEYNEELEERVKCYKE